MFYDCVGLRGGEGKLVRGSKEEVEGGGGFEEGVDDEGEGCGEEGEEGRWGGHCGWSCGRRRRRWWEWVF